MSVGFEPTARITTNNTLAGCRFKPLIQLTIIWLHIWVTIPANHGLTVRPMHHARVLWNKLLYYYIVDMIPRQLLFGGEPGIRTPYTLRWKIYSLLKSPMLLALRKWWRMRESNSQSRLAKPMLSHLTNSPLFSIIFFAIQQFMYFVFPL